jgi:hypothetical protein
MLPISRFRPIRRAGKLVLAAAILGLAVWCWRERPQTEHPPAADVIPASAEPAGLQASDLAPPEREQIPSTTAAGGRRIRVADYLTHEPIAGAKLELLSLDDQFDGGPLVTGTDGTASAPAATLAGVQLTITADRYCPIRQLLSDASEDPLEYALCTAGSVRVRVLDENRNPVQGAFVNAILASIGVPKEIRTVLGSEWPDFRGMRGSKPALTDSAGRWTVERMPCGLPLEVTVSRAVPTTSVKTTIDRVRRWKELEIVASTQRSIHGRLVWESGEAIDGTKIEELIKVYCFDQERSPNGRSKALCGADGGFTLRDLPAGRVTWRIDWPGEYSRCTTTKPGTTEVGDITLRGAEYVRGHVYRTAAPAGFDYGGIRLDFQQDGRPVRTVGVGHDGRFEVRLLVGPVKIDLSTGREICASLNREVPWGELSICLDSLFGSLRIKNLDLDPHQPAFLRLETVGRVEKNDVDNPPITHFCWVGQGAYELSAVRWKQADLCESFLRPGSYDVYVGYAVKSDFDLRDLVSAGRAVITAGEEFVLDAAQSRHGSIEGFVHTREGTPLPGTGVMAVPRAFLAIHVHDQPPSSVTDAEGRFRFESTPPGPWIVFPESLGPDSSEARTVEVEPGRGEHVDLTIEQPGSLAGVVTRKGVPDARVHVHVVAALAWSTHIPQSQNVLSDEGGRFEFHDLAPGRYIVSVAAGEMGSPEQRTLRRHFEVRSNETTRCDIDLDSDRTVLRVTLEGKPFDAVDGGYAADFDGFNRFAPAGPDGTGWGARLPDGPCLLLFDSKDVPTLDEPTIRRGYRVAYLPHASSQAAEVEVDIHGATIVVRPRSASATLPWARLESVGELKDIGDRVFNPALLAGFDGDGVRRFPCVPIGSTVVLKDVGQLAGPVQSQLVTVSTADEIEVLWPPR